MVVAQALDFQTFLQQLPSWVLGTPEIDFALEVFNACFQGLYATQGCPQGDCGLFFKTPDSDSADQMLMNPLQQKSLR